MKIEQQVCTLEQAKRLKELGVEQFIYLCWFKSPVAGKGIIIGFNNEMTSKFENYSAFTVAELGVMLPSVNISKGEFMHFCKGVNGGWSVDYSGEDAPGLPEKYMKLDHHYTEAEARAAMLIYLLENKIISVEEVNKRLAV